MLYPVRPEAMEADYPPTAGVPPGPLIGRWVYLGYFLPGGLMLAEDAERYLKGPFGGEELYCCVRVESGFAVVRNNAGHEYRVNPDRTIWVPTPHFQLGDAVRTKVGTRREGWVSGRGWHRKDSRLIYFIDIPGATGRRRHSRRYWEDELEPHSPIATF